MAKDDKKIRSTIGTDPEFFIKKTDTGVYVNAEKLFPGTKLEPHILKSGSGLQTDNVAVEFASAVAKDGLDLVKNIRDTFKELLQFIPKDHSLDAVPATKFDKSELVSEQAQKFGCDISYCAWELAEKTAPNAEDTNMRSIGGHVHIGKVDGDGNDFLLDDFGKINTVRTLDAFHGIISVVLDNTQDSVERRKLYGSAGDHRPKEYGVEYRTLSPFWLKSPNLVMLIDSLTQDVLSLVRSGAYEDIIEKIGSENIKTIINSGDYEKAGIIIEEVLLQYLSDNSKYFLNECRENMKKYTLEKEWGLT